jgi:hypothetical protein
MARFSQSPKRLFLRQRFSLKNNRFHEWKPQSCAFSSSVKTEKEQWRVHTKSGKKKKKKRNKEIEELILKGEEESQVVQMDLACVKR